MQSSNPVFRRSEGFNGRQGRASGMSYPAYGATPRRQGTQTYDPYAGTPGRPPRRTTAGSG